ncbi:hypothetical protein FQR65_LT20656 [Abscondita terminalis]|nr:hypothetical protein FQR65_LT20656 [Abscondita terminalis]
MGTSREGCDVGDLRLPAAKEISWEAVSPTVHPHRTLGASRVRPSTALRRLRRERCAAIVQAFLPGQLGGRHSPGAAGRIQPEWSPPRWDSSPHWWITEHLPGPDTSGREARRVSAFDHSPLYPFGVWPLLHGAYTRDRDGHQHRFASRRRRWCKLYVTDTVSSVDAPGARARGFHSCGAPIRASATVELRNTRIGCPFTGPDYVPSRRGRRVPRLQLVTGQSTVLSSAEYTVNDTSRASNTPGSVRWAHPQPNPHASSHQARHRHRPRKPSTVPPCALLPQESQRKAASSFALHEATQRPRTVDRSTYETPPDAPSRTSQAAPPSKACAAQPSVSWPPCSLADVSGRSPDENGLRVLLPIQTCRSAPWRDHHQTENQAGPWPAQSSRRPWAEEQEGTPSAGMDTQAIPAGCGRTARQRPARMPPRLTDDAPDQARFRQHTPAISSSVTCVVHIAALTTGPAVRNALQLSRPHLLIRSCFWITGISPYRAASTPSRATPLTGCATSASYAAVSSFSRSDPHRRFQRKIDSRSTALSNACGCGLLLKRGRLAACRVALFEASSFSPSFSAKLFRTSGDPLLAQPHRFQPGPNQNLHAEANSAPQSNEIDRLVGQLRAVMLAIDRLAAATNAESHIVTLCMRLITSLWPRRIATVDALIRATHSPSSLLKRRTPNYLLSATHERPKYRGNDRSYLSKGHSGDISRLMCAARGRPTTAFLLHRARMSTWALFLCRGVDGTLAHSAASQQFAGLHHGVRVCRAGNRVLRFTANWFERALPSSTRALVSSLAAYCVSPLVSCSGDGPAAYFGGHLSRAVGSTRVRKLCMDVRIQVPRHDPIALGATRLTTDTPERTHASA